MVERDGAEGGYGMPLLVEHLGEVMAHSVCCMKDAACVGLYPGTERRWHVGIYTLALLLEH
jgi:hypothetical protein